MPSSVLIAGIGNIFQGDDAFGVAVAQKLADIEFPETVKMIDVGIRTLDLSFALLDEYDLTILVDAARRGDAPGTLYTIQIQPEDIPDVSEQSAVVNSHSLDVVHVLAFAKSLGARIRQVLLIACEPLVVDRDETGHIGLSEVVQAAVQPAVETIIQSVRGFTQADAVKEQEEVYSHEQV